MRILFLSVFNPYGKYDVGAGNHLRNLSEQLTNLGCEIHILMPAVNNALEEKNGIFIHSVKSPSFSSFGKDISFSLFSVGTVQKLCSAYGIDIVHGQSPSSFGYALLGKIKKPYVVTLHGTSFGEISPYLNVPISEMNIHLLRDAVVIQPLEAFLTNIEYQKADKIIAVSRYLGNEAKNFYHIPKEKIVIIHNGVNLPSLTDRTESQNNSHVVLCVCRLIWRKGVQYLIDAMPKILKEYPNSKMKIVGVGELRSLLEERAKMMGVQGAVDFLGNVSGMELASLYRNSDVYVQPSLYEPLGITVLEAMSYGKPVVASKVGGIPEMITDKVDGLLVEPKNAFELEKNIIDLFADPATCRRYGQNARKKIQEHFLWPKIAGQTLKVYKNLA